MWQKCPICCENALRRCNNALLLQEYPKHVVKCPNFAMHIIIIIIIIIFFNSSISGYQGKTCDEKCGFNKWGKNCNEDCRCLNEAACDSRDGYCDCREGFTGEFCQSTCSQGEYGKDCKKKCQCQNNADCRR